MPLNSMIGESVWLVGLRPLWGRHPLWAGMQKTLWLKSLRKLLCDMICMCVHPSTNVCGESFVNSYVWHWSSWFLCVISLPSQMEAYFCGKPWFPYVWTCDTTSILFIPSIILCATIYVIIHYEMNLLVWSDISIGLCVSVNNRGNTK